MSILFIRFFISFSMQLFIYFFLPFSEINFVPNSYISANFCQIIQKIVELYTYVYIILYRNLIYCYAEEFYMKSDLQFKEDSKLIHKYLNEIRKGLNTHTLLLESFLFSIYLKITVQRKITNGIRNRAKIILLINGYCFKINNSLW